MRTYGSLLCQWKRWRKDEEFKEKVIIEAVQFNRSKAEKDVAKYYPMVTDMARLTTAKGTEERENRFFIST